MSLYINFMAELAKEEDISITKLEYNQDTLLSELDVFYLTNALIAIADLYEIQGVTEFFYKIYADEKATIGMLCAGLNAMHDKKKVFGGCYV